MRRTNGINRVSSFYVSATPVTADRITPPSARWPDTYSQAKSLDGSQHLDSTRLALGYTTPLLAFSAAMSICGFGACMFAYSFAELLDWPTQIDAKDAIVCGVGAVGLGSLAGFGALVTLAVRMAGASNEERHAVGSTWPTANPKSH